MSESEYRRNGSDRSARETSPALKAARRFRSTNPNGGRALQMPEPMSERISHSFGLDADEISFRESEDAARNGMLAYAKGNVVSFAPGTFHPETREGQKLIGHELHHITEQASGSLHPNVGGSDILYDSSRETAANHVGGSFASGDLSAAGPVSLAGISARNAPAQGLFSFFKSRKSKAQKRAKKFKYLDKEYGPETANLLRRTFKLETLDGDAGDFNREFVHSLKKLPRRRGRSGAYDNKYMMMRQKKRLWSKRSNHHRGKRGWGWVSRIKKLFSKNRYDKLYSKQIPERDEYKREEKEHLHDARNISALYEKALIKKYGKRGGDYAGSNFADILGESDANAIRASQRSLFRRQRKAESQAYISPKEAREREASESTPITEWKKDFDFPDDGVDLFAEDFEFTDKDRNVDIYSGDYEEEDESDDGEDEPYVEEDYPYDEEEESDAEEEEPDVMDVAEDESDEAGSDYDEIEQDEL